MPFACSICEEESTRICVYCTKDACANHLCDRCHRCSDCCECDVPLEETAPAIHAAGPKPDPDPQPEPPHPPPDPDPFPVDPEISAPQPQDQAPEH